jgi:hypothetical protein
MRLSAATAPPLDPDAPSTEPKFSLMHEYSWILSPSAAAAVAAASTGVFEFWGPAASPHRLSIVCAADGSARVRACIRQGPDAPAPLPPVYLYLIFPSLCTSAPSPLPRHLPHVTSSPKRTHAQPPLPRMLPPQSPPLTAATLCRASCRSPTLLPLLMCLPPLLAASVLK